MCRRNQKLWLYISWEPPMLNQYVLYKYMINIEKIKRIAVLVTIIMLQ